jgi:hypothetical protein
MNDDTKYYVLLIIVVGFVFSVWGTIFYFIFNILKHFNIIH